MDALLQDLRYALRGLRRSPGFTLAAVLTLALGIGANTTVFSAANAFVLRPADARDPGRLLRVYSNRHSPLGYDQFRYLQEHSRVFSGMTAERNAILAMGGRQGNERVFGALVNGGYFAVLGIPAAAGRMLTPGDDTAPGAHPVVVLSHAFWTRRFGASPSVVGQTITLSGKPYTVIGVAREGFTGSGPGFAPQLWAPIAEAQPLTGWNPAESGSSVYVHGRLRDGFDRRQAQAAMAAAAGALTRLDPERREPVRLTLDPARGIHKELRGPAMAGSAMLLAVVAGVLLMCCANIANLLLARAVARRKEIGIRLALGAGRGRLVRQLLTEAMLLALGGAALGMALAVVGVDALKRFIPQNEPIAVNLSPDVRVLGFTLVISVAAAVLCGLFPARRATSPDLVQSLRPDATLQGRMRTRLVLAQSALCTVLLGGALLFLRSLGNAAEIHPGFEVNQVLNLSVNLSLGAYDDARGAEYYRRLVEAAEALPGVRSAAIGEVVPLGGSNMETRFSLPGDAEENTRHTYFNIVGPKYFATLGIGLLDGRELAPGAANEVVVNRAFAERTWPGRRAVGQQVTFDDRPLTVVGVSRDAKYVTRGEDARPTLYASHAYANSREMTLHVRTAGDPALLKRPLRAAAEALDPALPLPAPRTMKEDTGISLLPARFAAILLGAFGVVALLLAAIGIYGVVSYAVVQRTKEIGIRAALGATQAMLLRLIVGGGIRPVLIGTGVGLLLAMGLTRAAGALLYGVTPLDPALVLGTPLVLVGTALAASLIPARRATRVDPLLALRSE
jgi:predicted permease